MIPLIDRFFSKVNLQGPILRPELGPCWEWTGTINKRYGVLNVGGRKGKMRRAHVVAWFLTTGTWPKLNVLHKCDNPLCVRYFHLFEGTHRENMEDMARKGRSKAPKGIDNGNAKINEKVVRAIRKGLAKGASQAAIAQLHGISKRTVWDIKEKNTWGYVI